MPCVAGALTGVLLQTRTAKPGTACTVRVSVDRHVVLAATLRLAGFRARRRMTACDSCRCQLAFYCDCLVAVDLYDDLPAHALIRGEL